MKFTQRILLGFVFVLFLTAGFLPVAAQAQGILPATNFGVEACLTAAREANLRSAEAFKTFVKDNPERLRQVLGCAIKTGKIRLFMMPFFITYLIEFLLGIAGLIAVLFMVIGGYKYAVGGITEDKESGKKTILHALLGFIVALSAWIVVNFIQVALTS